MFENYKNQIETSFKLAEEYKSKITNEVINLEGMTGLKTRHFYNNILNMDDARYLEIGTWKGSSVCSAMYKNKAKVVCIDNWSEFKFLKKEFLNNLYKFEGENNIMFIENDCFSIDISKILKFNIYMYDGNHSYESHSMALTHYYDCLDDIFIYIIDDWNWNYVRDGTMDGINKCNLKVLYEKEIKLSDDNTTTHDKEGWWNGMCVYILQK